jgi:hypothetical protein
VDKDVSSYDSDGEEYDIVETTLPAPIVKPEEQNLKG